MLCINVVKKCGLKVSGLGMCVFFILNIILVMVGKLASRSQRVAHYLLNKLGGGKALVPGDRVRHRGRTRPVLCVFTVTWCCSGGVGV